uniref:Tcstv family member 6A n=1 Tax=Mus musculus TaxID=10090 RepID=J3QMN9_MOUSE
LKRLAPAFVKDTSDSADYELLSAQVLPSLSSQCSKSEPLRFGRQTSHCSEDGGIIDWDLYLDYKRYYRRSNCTMKKGTEVFQSESQRDPQVSRGDVDNNKEKDTEEPDLLLLSLLREKGLELETCDGGDCPDQDSASDS